jgi:hypothetical protein
MVFFHQAPSQIQRGVEVCAAVRTYKSLDDILSRDLGLNFHLGRGVVSDDGDLGVILKQGVLLNVCDELGDCGCEVSPLARPIGVLR